MKKKLAGLEKSNALWSLTALSFLFFLLRLPSLIEPDWYTDEGMYQVIGRALDSGRLLYMQIWDNKPPLLYLIYASVNGDLFMAKLLSLIVGLVALIVFFLLCQKLFANLRFSLIASFLFTFLFATPILTADIANAENFLILPILTSALIILPSANNATHSLKIKHGKKTFIAGLLLGIAFLIKTVAVFDFIAFFLFYFFINIKSLNITKLRQNFKNQFDYLFFAQFILGFIIPFILTSFYFLQQRSFTIFIQSVFLDNVGYVGWGNALIIPQGLLILKGAFLIVALAIIFRYRFRLSAPILAILIWTCISVFNAFFAQRPYMHYLIVLIPSFCLSLAIFIYKIKAKFKITYISILGIILFLIIITFNYTLSTLLYQYKYYTNALSFITGRQSTTSYMSFFDPLTQRDYEVADFINALPGKNSASVFIWGDRPQIYALSNTLPPGRFTVAYHITLSDNNLRQTQNMLVTDKPKYIITLNEEESFPFVVYNYHQVYMITGATVYEKDE